MQGTSYALADLKKKKKNSNHFRSELVFAEYSVYSVL